MYDQLALYYDSIHEQLTADIPFVLQLAAEARGPVLELGCGSGRLLFPLARAGYPVTGVDNSAEMLARARQRLVAEPPAVQSRVRLIELDMVADLGTDMGGGELTDEDGRYALVFAGYNTFMQLTPSQMRATLRRVRRWLRPAGRLFLDLSNSFILAQAEDAPLLRLENILRDSQTGNVVRQLSAHRLDAAGQVLHVTWAFDAGASGDGRIQRSLVEMDYFYYYPHEWELFLLDAGLRLESLVGDYDGASFGEESERMLLIGSPAS